ncbi:MAG: GNAT family N-acetyltransferase [Candidatus Delongbacteria bacterium]|nr:GNAT family N-acetyltransferase [Candidatus Delongbacteria bacterium]
MEIKVIPEKDYDEMVRITQAAYAGSFTGAPDEGERIKKMVEGMLSEDPILLLGAYENEELLGTVLHYTFETNFHGEFIKTAGIGMLAVDLLHKKKGVAQALILDSIKRAKEENITLYYLYPFNTRFYRNFGFGYGAPVYTYCVKPQDFKGTGLKFLLSYGCEKDFENMHKIYDDQARKTNGMSLRLNSEKSRINRYQGKKLLVAKDGDELIGYMFFHQKGLNSDNNQSQKLKVTDMLYTNSKALMAFTDFFHDQKDQIDYIEIATFNPNFHQLLENTLYVPKPQTLDIISLKVADVGLGLMPLVLDPEFLLKKVTKNLSYGLKFNILEKEHLTTVQTGVHTDIEMTCSINSFSSWITGVISLKALYETGQLETTQVDLLKKIDCQLAFDSPESYTRY